MSQYPQPPYVPPPQPDYGYDFRYYQPQQQDPLTPARRAGLMMFVLGGLIILPSFCCGAMGLALPALMAQQPGVFSEMSAAGLTPEAIQVTLVVAAGVALFAGVIMIVLGRFVRSGAMGAIVTAIVLATLLALYLLLNTVGILVISGMPPAQRVLGMVISVLGLGLIGLLIVWLIQAAKSAPRIGMMKSQYQQQLWQYQQQQQMYQAGYLGPPPSQAGYETPTPPPPPSASLPDDPSRGDPNGPAT